jgi:hypothetical protein
MRPCRTNNPEEVFPASVLTTSRLQILPEYSVPGAGHEPTIKSLRGNSLENRACDHSPTEQTLWRPLTNLNTVGLYSSLQSHEFLADVRRHLKWRDMFYEPFICI